MKRVGFREKPDIKPATVLRSEVFDTLLNDIALIRRLKTIDECDSYCDRLLEELKVLKKKKKELKFDVSQEMDELMQKLGVLEEVKQDLLKKNELKGKYYSFKFQKIIFTRVYVLKVTRVISSKKIFI